MRGSTVAEETGEISTVRVGRDARGERTSYDQIVVGEDLGTLEWIVNEGDPDGLMENDDDFHEWYTESSPFGYPIVPQMFTYPPVRVLFAKKYSIRGLFYLFETDYVRPIPYGRVIIISGKVTDKYIKRNREYVVYEAEAHLKDTGELLFRTRRGHALDYITVDRPRDGVGVDSASLK
jgi:hypothetical protein